VIHDKIDQDTKASLSTSLGELNKVSQRAVAGIDSVIIGNVVAIVATRRGLERKQPDCRYPQALQVIEAKEEASKIADPISVRVEVGSDGQAIDDCIFVPEVVDHEESSGYGLQLADRFYLERYWFGNLGA
jgi:hypothetical protein